jgi:hypothetical protein
MMEKGDRLLAWLANLTSVATAVIAVIIFYTTSRQPRLTYYVDPVRTTIADPTRTNRIKVLLDGDPKPVTVPVMAAQISVFNDGTYLVNGEEATDDEIRIVSKPATALLDAFAQPTSIVKATRFETDKRQLNSGIVPVKWSFLGDHDGATIHLLYLAGRGTAAPAFNVQGRLRTQKTIIELDPRRTRRWRLLSIAVLMFAALALAVGFLYAVIDKKVVMALSFIVAVFAVVALLVWTIQVTISGTLLPPGV